MLSPVKSTIYWRAQNLSVYIFLSKNYLPEFETWNPVSSWRKGKVFNTNQWSVKKLLSFEQKLIK